MTTALMIQGTGSHVGKSVLTAGLCRIFREDGINVAPFKSQNMALNSYVTEDGREMGRAQVVQAEAAGLKPDADMNPILLKPHSDQGSQVIIHGKVYGNLSAREFYSFKEEAKGFVKTSYDRLAARHELIVIEGAGSPAEINLRENDIANMGTAHLVDAPVILVGDIDRGGVFASLVGTLELLDDADRKRIKGFIINKFRGDISLLKPGLDFLEEKTGLPVLGVVPWFRDIYIEEEDGVGAGKVAVQNMSDHAVRIAVIHLPRISNFTDFDPFMADEGVNIRYVKEGEGIGEADIVIIPGTKSTIADLKYLKDAGYDAEIRSHVASGGTLIGICGGYQMLGNKITDPHHVEGGGELEGLGHLEIETVLEKDKTAHQVKARQVSALFESLDQGELSGYEIHMGKTEYKGRTMPLFELTSRSGKSIKVSDGAASADGKIWGTYMHGIFENETFRHQLLQGVKGKAAGIKAPERSFPEKSFKARKEEGFDRLAKLLRKNIDMAKVSAIAGIT